MTDALAWDTYSRQRPERRPVNGRGETTWFNWTQYPDHGPGAEVLALPKAGRALDLGCGKGGNAAHLAALGHQAVGVDLSPRQLDAARDRWGNVPGLAFHHGTALDYLHQPGPAFDAIYSVFGAVYFSEPGTLLSAVHARLRPGGTFVFSQPPAVESGYGCQASYIPRGDDEDPLVVKRWDYLPEVWQQLLREYGFTKVTTRILAPPAGHRRIGTLLVQAQA